MMRHLQRRLAVWGIAPGMLRSDIPFSRDDANRFLPWMVALMCGITALMLCVGITLGHWVHGQQRHASAAFTVQVPPQGERHNQVVKAVMDELEHAEGVSSARLLQNEEVQALVEPWLGGSDAVRALPLPSVIEASADGQPDYAGLTHRLHTLAPDISVDTQEIWADKFSRLSRALQTVAYGLALFIVAALAGMMVFAARAAMKLHADTVTLLHAVGADDSYIARQFQTNALRLALWGAVPGTLAAGAAYALFALYAARLNAPMMPDLSPGLAHILMLVLLPAACCTVSMVAVRLATLAQLRLLP